MTDLIDLKSSPRRLARPARRAAWVVGLLLFLAVVATEVRVGSQNRAVAVIESAGGTIARQPLLPLVWHLRLERLLGEHHLPLFTAVRGVRFDGRATASDLRMALRSAAALPGLEWIDLSRTRIDRQGLEELSEACCLDILDLRSTDIDNHAIESMLRLRRVTTLFLGHSGLEGSAWLRLLSMPRLETLQLDATTIIVEPPGLDGPVTSRLRTLSLASTTIDGADLRVLAAALPGLTEIDLSHAGIDDDDLQALDLLHDLATVNLTGTRVSSAGTSRLSQHPGMRLIVAPEITRQPDDLTDPLILYR